MHELKNGPQNQNLYMTIVMYKFWFKQTFSTGLYYEFHNIITFHAWKSWVRTICCSIQSLKYTDNKFSYLFNSQLCKYRYILNYKIISCKISVCHSNVSFDFKFQITSIVLKRTDFNIISRILLLWNLAGWISIEELIPYWKWSLE